MNLNTRRVVGILLVIFGVFFLLDKLEILEFSPLFTGWWTLFLIIPAILSMGKNGVNVGNAILLAIGVFFLLEERGWNIRGFFVPSVLILFGIVLVLNKKN
ncbi:MAG: DUF5668 domain-containing protein [Candidatus Izemoplasmatales bacterium]|mgnify:CR=1 FL=1|jgi:hypothetical protein|nr:DUF5668 domain-containing protein [Candidatus Izemoplasmatales bacterium]NLF49013.1 hypothetical protein [Acholeplasmataceae bacterium]MDD4355240.1 DUF5668 domain-containing protein [Candidatus Izemoplasmatales bacterium]MDD4987262.1 DUF5668 domain-containing protein [Candidatus Izemoplasmatales bacterium]MDD5601633.1 DUF5668 domain-containing protein [Candidatus Izemoplasmatales bacterium]